jgi:hypothetical protein
MLSLRENALLFPLIPMSAGFFFSKTWHHGTTLENTETFADSSYIVVLIKY